MDFSVLHPVCMWICLILYVTWLPVSAIQGQHLRITSILVEPYLMLNPEGTDHSGNVRFVGYIPDLVSALSEGLGFNYELQVVRDGRYGNRRSGNTWDGMIGELVRNEADIAAAPLYATQQRERVVEFSEPFLTVQATLLLSEYHDYPGILAARDLVGQSRIQYGTLNTGVIINAFKHTNQSVYKQMWNNMKNSPQSVFTISNIEGVDRVRRGQYAFILPSTIGHYISKQTYCDLRTIDNFLMNRTFALAVAKNSGMDHILERINKYIRLLRRRGKLEGIYNKWWVDRNHCGAIKRSSVNSQDQPLMFSVATKPPVISELSLMCSVCIFLTHRYSRLQVLI